MQQGLLEICQRITAQFAPLGAGFYQLFKLNSQKTIKNQKKLDTTQKS